MRRAGHRHDREHRRQRIVTSVVQHRVRTGDGITLAAEYYPHDGDRPVVFLLHGGGQNRHAWTTSARRLQSRGYSVVAYDTRGHGDSDWDPAGRYDVERLATDLLAVRDHFSANTPNASGRRFTRVKPASPSRRITPPVMFAPDLLAGSPT